MWSIKFRNSMQSNILAPSNPNISTQFGNLTCFKVIISMKNKNKVVVIHSWPEPIAIRACKQAKMTRNLSFKGHNVNMTRVT